MASLSDTLLNIIVGSKFDAKGFKQAETATAKLNKSVKNLGRTLGYTFATASIVAFGKASVKAFAADDAAARSLGKTLENLGLNIGMSSQVMNEYISRLEQSTGVLDDELRPAMDRFLRATMDAKKSQELLNLALDISAGTGKDLTTVSQGLQKAYLGQTQSLGRLGVGLTKAELTNSSFLDIQKRLSVLFAGQAADAADSYQGQLNKLTVASNNAKEAIGKGLVDALITLSDDKNINSVIAGIEKITNAIVTATGAVAKFINVTNPFGKGGFKWTIPKTTPGLAVAGGAAKDRLNIANAKRANALAKEGNSLKQIDNTATANKIKLSGDELALRQLQKIFDIDRIQIQAALKTATDQETEARLKALMVLKDQDSAQAKLALAALNATGALDAMKAAIMADVAAMQAKLNAAISNIQGTASSSIVTPASPYYFLSPEYSTEAARSAAGTQQITISLDGQVFQNAVLSATQGGSSNGNTVSYSSLV